MYMREELEKLCHKAMDSIAESNKKLDKDGERLNTSDAEYLAYLVKIVKSCKTVIAMDDYSDDEYSGDSGYSGARYVRRMRYTEPSGYRRY